MNGVEKERSGGDNKGKDGQTDGQKGSRINTDNVKDTGIDFGKEEQ